MGRNALTAGIPVKMETVSMKMRTTDGTERRVAASPRTLPAPRSLGVTFPELPLKNTPKITAPERRTVAEA